MQRTNAMYKFRTSLGNFGDTFYGKRACLHCLLSCDTFVLDSEWHWLFDCVLLDELRMKFPSLFKILKSIRSSKDFAVLSDLCSFLDAIQNDSRLVFSLASFLRQAISVKECRLGEVCVRGRLCTPPDHWFRNLFEDPPSDAEFPPDFEESYMDGKPWFFSHEVFDACPP